MDIVSLMWLNYCLRLGRYPPTVPVPSTVTSLNLYIRVTLEELTVLSVGLLTVVACMGEGKG